MRERERCSVFLMLVAFVILGGCASAVSEPPPGAMKAEIPADAELKQRLCAGSPWESPSGSPRYPGTVELIFSCEGGKFSAEIYPRLAGTNPPSGKVLFLRIEQGVVKYRTPAGSNAELTLDREGRLVGKTFHPYGGTFELVFRSKASKKP